MAAPAGDNPNDVHKKQRVPRVALVSSGEPSDLLSSFKSRFVRRSLTTPEELERLLIGYPLDLVILDFRERAPSSHLFVALKDERIVQFLAVGRPEDRKTIPSWLESHWCPWPIHKRAFYRLISALAALGRTMRNFEKLRGDNERLTEEALLGRQTAEVLHEIGNPLDAAMRFVRLASTSEGLDESKEHLVHARTALERIAEATGRLRRDARKTAVRLSATDLRELIREAALLAGLLSEEFALTIDIKGGPYFVPKVLGRVLVNLLDNARQSCGESGKIDIQVAVVHSSLEIAVKDDGEGFADLFREEIFKPYMSFKADGLGLGLPQSRYLCEQLGGTLDGNSLGLGKGAVFSMRIPMSRISTAESPAAPAGPEKKASDLS